MIVLIDVSKKGEVIHRLRGHDDEIHALAWSPLAHEDALYTRPEDGEGNVVFLCIIVGSLAYNIKHPEATAVVIWAVFKLSSLFFFLKYVRCAWRSQFNTSIWDFFFSSHVIATNGVSGGGGCYLASGSKDQTVRLWSTAKGKGGFMFIFKIYFLIDAAEISLEEENVSFTMSV